MKLTIAYGVPASGKTVLLKSLKGNYYDFDTPEKRFHVKDFIKEMKDKEYVLDSMIFNPNEFIEYVHKLHPTCFITIYVLNTDRNICLTRDDERLRSRKSYKLIKNMKLKEIIPKNNLKIIEVI